MPRTRATPTTRETEIFYSESDGKPLGETGTHIDVTLTLLDVLRRYYMPRRDVAILSNMFVYYVEGNPRKNVAPDLFVMLGIPANTKRRTFKVRIKADSGRLPSEVLGLHLERDGSDLRLYNPHTKAWERTSEEVAATLREREAALQRSEAALRNEEAARRQAQDEAERLRHEVIELKKKLKEGH